MCPHNSFNEKGDCIYCGGQLPVLRETIQRRNEQRNIIRKLEAQLAELKRERDEDVLPLLALYQEQREILKGLIESFDLAQEELPPIVSLAVEGYFHLEIPRA